MNVISIKRVYETPSKKDGYRMLIDKIWPRGIKKEDAQLDEWNKTIAPSTELRKWFAHKDERFQEFTKRYENELKTKTNELTHIVQLAKKQPVCLLYGAKNTHANHAIVLKKTLENFTS